MNYGIQKQFDWMRGVYQFKVTIDNYYIEFFKTIDEAYQYVADMTLFLELEAVS